MIADTVLTDVKKDTGDRPVIQIVALIVSTTHVLPQMEYVLQGVNQGTGETHVIRHALQIVTIGPVPYMTGTVLAVNRIGQETGVTNATPNITDQVVLPHAV